MITSSKNPKIQWVSRLIRKSNARHADKAFVIEGVRLIEEAYFADWEINHILYTETLSDRGMNLVNNFHGSETEIEIVSENVMRTISDTKNPQGITAVVGMQSLAVTDQLYLILILDQLRDPGNMGTLLRTCAAANVQAVFITPNSVDIFSPKVLRAGMGAQFQIPILSAGWSEIKNLVSNSNLHVYLATSAGGSVYYEAEFQRPLALIIGGEAEGASEMALQLADSYIKIPMPGGGESLNAAFAAGILLFEIARQREQKQ